MERYSVKLVNDPYPRRPGVEKNDQGQLVMYEDAQSALAAKDAEIAKLRADLDQARRDRNSAVECAEVLRGYVAEHKAALAAARADAANDVER